MRNRRFVSSVLAVLTMCYASSLGQDKGNTDVLENAPPILGESYHCQDMVRVVNVLRAGGKEQALAALRTHLRRIGSSGDPMEAKKVLLVCRLLFVNSGGWPAPRLGHAEPDVDRGVVKRFPVFPIALSHGVPFLLIRGYSSGGHTEDTPEKCVDLCESLPFVTADLPEVGFEKAARELAESEAFQKLYLSPRDKREAIEMILSQAASPSPVRKGRAAEK